jgi:DNA-binding CsgD family transcriptional regulator
MEGKVAVVHRSEIVRKGLSNILNSFWKNDIIQCGDVKSFLNRGLCSTYHTLVFVDAEEAEILVSAAGSSTIVAIYDSESQIKQNDKTYFRVSLRSDLEVFRNIVEDFKNQFTHDVENENELTLREKEILKQVAMGLSNKEIADNLFISIHTVMTHRKNITGKLGIKSISGLTVYAIINRLIDPDLIDPEKLI